jgi:signal transduction histidine kinase
VGQVAEVWVLLNAGELHTPDDETAGHIPAGELHAFPSDPPVPDLALVQQAIQEATLQASGGEDQPARLAFPLLQGGRTRGAVLVERLQPFNAVEIEFLGHLCGRAAAAFENARLYLAVQSANQAKTKFVSVVTHELRIPMTSIKGYTDLLRQGAVGPVNEMQANFLNVIRNNVDRMSALVSDLSDISRIETGRLKIDLKPVSVAEHADEVLRSLEPRLEEKHQVLELELPADLPPVHADPNRVVQVLTNLLSNAWKYTPEGGCIRLKAVPEAGSVRVTVADTGIGISPEDQAKLFSQFFRSEDPLVREQQGWGLGLNVARRLVEVMGGEIGCESALGQGSTFWFTLPVHSTP